jgi:molybdopterin-guanine dinucleotide biosynthesis protein A
MGRDKAFVDFQGVPMIQLAVERLRGICAEVGILGNDPALARFGELFPDESVECGPLSGIVQALKVTECDWNLMTPVDLPLLPGGLLRGWMGNVLSEQPEPPLVCCLADAGQPQPLVCLLHRSVGSFLADALLRGERKVLPLLKAAGSFRMMEVNDPWRDEVWTATAQEWALRDLWFGNANTPEELAELERRAREAGVC